MKPIQEVIEALDRGEMGDDLGEASQPHEMIVCDIMGPEDRERNAIRPWVGLALYDPLQDLMFFDSRHAGLNPEDALSFAADCGSLIVPYPALGAVFLPLFDLVVLACALGGRYTLVAEGLIMVAEKARAEIAERDKVGP